MRAPQPKPEKQNDLEKLTHIIIQNCQNILSNVLNNFGEVTPEEKTAVMEISKNPELLKKMRIEIEDSKTKVLNKREACKFLKISKRKLEYMMGDGTITFSKEGRRVQFLKENLIKHVKQNEI